MIQSYGECTFPGFLIFGPEIDNFSSMQPKEKKKKGCVFKQKFLSTSLIQNQLNFRESI